MMDGPFAQKMERFQAHYEHNVCVRKNKADVLSSFEEIEKAEKANVNLKSDYYS
jgi:methionyl aminopeptidase